jgi:hypothetical protein
MRNDCAIKYAVELADNLNKGIKDYNSNIEFNYPDSSDRFIQDVITIFNSRYPVLLRKYRNLIKELAGKYYKSNKSYFNY